MLSLTHFELDISARGRGIQQLYSILSSNDFKNDIRKSVLLLFARKKNMLLLWFTQVFGQCKNCGRYIFAKN